MKLKNTLIYLTLLLLLSACWNERLYHQNVTTQAECTIRDGYW